MAKKARYEVQMVPRFIGIETAAQKLGRSVYHVREVLIGRRKSPDLLRRIQKEFPGLLKPTRGGAQ